MLVMNGLKKFGLVVSVALFGPLFLLSVFSVTFSRTLGDQDYTKQTIAQTGFYAAVGETITTQAVGEAGGEPLITAALQSAVSGDKIQTTLEPLIESTYAWLGGNVQQPEFKLQIEPIKANFEQSLTTALQARAASLPPCSQANPPTTSDVYSINCIPPDTDVNAAIADAVTRVSGNASVFSDEVVADGTVNTNETAELGVNDPTQDLPKALPNFYQFLTKGMWFFIGGTVLTGVGIILLSRDWLHGLRKLGVLLVINGLGALVLGLIMHYTVSSLIPTTSVDATESIVNALQQASKVVIADNAEILKIVGAASLVLGVSSVVISSIVISKKQSPKLSDNQPVPIRDRNDITKTGGLKN